MYDQKQVQLKFESQVVLHKAAGWSCCWQHNFVLRAKSTGILQLIFSLTALRPELFTTIRVGKAALQGSAVPPLPHGSPPSCGLTLVSMLSPSWPCKAMWNLWAALPCREARKGASLKVLLLVFLGLSLAAVLPQGYRRLQCLGQESQRIYPQMRPRVQDEMRRVRCHP